MTNLQEFAQNVWIADGPLVRDVGLLFTTRMTVVKLSDGSVWVESPVPVPLETLKHITDLGPVRYVLAATPRHVWRLQADYAVSWSPALGGSQRSTDFEASAPAIDGHSGRRAASRLGG